MTYKQPNNFTEKEWQELISKGPMFAFDHIHEIYESSAKIERVEYDDYNAQDKDQVIKKLTDRIISLEEQLFQAEESYKHLQRQVNNPAFF